MENTPKWLNEAIFYQVYPQSFCDSNGDGIGDIPGIISKLDYIQSTGFNAIWINPCFSSPFKDAGYDVQDYYKVAPRYGKNRDLFRLFEEAHKRGMHVLLDLVPGHTSDQCSWFKASVRPEYNQFSDRYIWTESAWHRPEGYNWVTGKYDRDGSYMLNFFVNQPALNYGFNIVTEPEWQYSYKDPRVQPTYKAMIRIMRYWLTRGADGFRVDMADSLVKNDPKKAATSAIWRRVRRMMNHHFPEAAMVSEWCDAPTAIVGAGFHCDFLLNHGGKLTDRAFYRRNEDGTSGAYFCKTAHVPADEMLSLYLDELRRTRANGYISVVSGNHDVPRLSSYLDETERKLAFVFLLTLPGVPFVYYGDEIGMRYLPQRSKEGGYSRTGSRTPMQWDADLPNLGFSDAQREKLYLDVDRAEDAPCVKQQQEDPNSLWNLVHSLCQLRRRREDLLGDSLMEVVRSEGCLLCYRRGKNTFVAINPTDRDELLTKEAKNVLFSLGNAQPLVGGFRMGPQSAIIFEQ